jgi:ketose-bisphosphate aldolase
MIASLPGLLTDRRSQCAALGAFTTYDLETATAVLAAAGDIGVPVMLLVSRSAFAAPGGDQLLAAVLAAADTSGVRCCVQLDHVGDLELMERALRLGCGALMADGSTLPLDENRELVARAVALASGYGAHVEAELGHVAGGEDVSEWAQSGQLTDPDEAARFAADTGAACLAVSVGNVHGTYAQPPQLDWARLEAVRDATPVPVSLHGASGIPDEDLRQAIALGVAKINVNTELREAYLAASERHMHEALNGSRLFDLHERQREAVRGVVARKLVLYSGTRA